MYLYYYNELLRVSLHIISRGELIFFLMFLIFIDRHVIFFFFLTGETQLIKNES
jgi:hypothetical protein